MDLIGGPHGRGAIGSPLDAGPAALAAHNIAGGKHRQRTRLALGSVGGPRAAWAIQDARIGRGARSCRYGHAGATSTTCAQQNCWPI